MNDMEVLRQELAHLEEYLADRRRLAYKLSNGKWNMEPLTKAEKRQILGRIAYLKKVLKNE